MRNTRDTSMPASLLLRLVLILQLCLCAPNALGRVNAQDRQPSQDDEGLSLTTHLVNVDVIVKDKKGKYVTDLTAQDFTVFENGVRQNVEFFDPPLGGIDEAATPSVAAPATSRPS